MLMKRTSLFLDDDMTAVVQKLAQKRGVSFATVVREALAEYVVSSRTKPKIPSIAGRFASGESDTSERVDELLWRDPHA